MKLKDEVKNEYMTVLPISWEDVEICTKKEPRKRIQDSSDEEWRKGMDRRERLEDIIVCREFRTIGEAIKKTVL